MAVIATDKRNRHYTEMRVWSIGAILWVVTCLAIAITIDLPASGRRNSHLPHSVVQPVIVAVLCALLAACRVARLQVHVLKVWYRWGLAVAGGLSALGGVGLAVFLVWSAIQGAAGCRTNGYPQLFAAFLIAWIGAGVLAMIETVIAGVLSGNIREWRVLLLGPLMWVVGGVTLWNTGLAFMMD